MGNLGGYQTMTTIVKALGGPVKAAVVIIGGSFVAGGAVFAGGQKVIKVVTSALEKRNTPCPTQGQLFAVLSDGEDGNGLKLSAGAEYRVLECDGDAIQIEVLGDGDNPYFVSAEFLATVSDFPAEDPAQES